MEEVLLVPEEGLTKTKEVQSAVARSSVIGWKVGHEVSPGAAGGRGRSFLGCGSAPFIGSQLW